MVAHAWTAYQHARYPSLTALVPDLLAHAQRAHARHPGPGRAPLVDAYRVTAALLVKLGEADLAWLAADRAIGPRGDGCPPSTGAEIGIYAARAYLQADDPVSAGRALVEAEGPTRRDPPPPRPAREVVAQVARYPVAPEDHPTRGDAERDLIRIDSDGARRYDTPKASGLRAGGA